MIQRLAKNITTGVRTHAAVLYTLLSAGIIIVGAFFVIRYAQGDMRLTESGVARNTGLLSANSQPTGAEVFINDRLTTATDDTLYLEPGQYDISIRREGFTTWNKTVTIRRQLVTQTNARLFPTTPNLTPLTFTGLQNVLPSPDGQRLLYYTSGASTQRRNGLYIFELTDSPLSFQRGPRQIAQDSAVIDLATADFIWSPDSTQVLLLSEQKQLLLETNTMQNLDAASDISLSSSQLLTEWEQELYLRERQLLAQFPAPVVEIATQSARNVYLSPDNKRVVYTATQSAVLQANPRSVLPTTNTHPETRELIAGDIYVYDREEDKNYRVGSERAFERVATSGDDSASGDEGASGDSTASAALDFKWLLSSVSEANGTAAIEMSELEASDSAKLATQSANQPDQLASDQSDQPDQPDQSASESALAPNLPERNFNSLQANALAHTAQQFRQYYSSLYTQTYQWHPGSHHLLTTQNDGISIKEFDGTNMHELYRGPFNTSFLFAWPDGNRLLFMTSFNSDSPENLYALGLN